MNGSNEFLVVIIQTIIPPNDKDQAVYVLQIKNSKQISWNKQCTMAEIRQFRNYITRFVPSIDNVPFPTAKKMSYIPFIGKDYGESNWDILLENKFILENFFDTLCKDIQLYKLEGFTQFFAMLKETNLDNSFKV